MQKRFLIQFIALLFIFSTFGCSSDPSSQLIGAWKTEEIGTFSGKPDILIFFKNELVINKQKLGVTFEAVGNQINVINAAHKNTIFAVADISENSITVRQGMSNNGKYTRITAEEAEAVLNQPEKEITGKNSPPIKF